MTYTKGQVQGSEFRVRQILRVRLGLGSQGPEMFVRQP